MRFAVSRYARLAPALAATLVLIGHGRVSAAPGARARGPGVAEAGARGDLKGQALRVGDRAPIAGATVLMVAEPGSAEPGPVDAESINPDPGVVARAQTDDAGRFELGAELTDARVRVVIIAPGYQRLDYVVDRDRERAAEKTARFFLSPDEAGSYRTVVRDRNETPDEGGFNPRKLRGDELDTVPGAWGDPLLALQNMPGFFRAPAGLGVAIIRAGNPSGSRTFVGEHPVPRVFHVLPFTSVVPAPFVERIDYEAGNFGARYGDAVIGVIRVEPRRGGSDHDGGYHGHAQLSLMSVGASVEGQAGPGTFLVAARRGYSDALLKVANRFGGQFSYPSYYDYQALYDMPLRSGGTVGVHVLGAGDKVRTDERGVTGDAGRTFRADFHRVDLVYRRELGPYQVLLSPAFRLDVSGDNPETFGSDEEGFYRYIEQQRRHDFNALLRAELRRRWTRRLSTTLGADAQIDPYRVTRRSEGGPSAPPERGTLGAIGLYAQATIEHGPLRLIPATRLSGFFVGSQAGFSVDPRLTLRGLLGERWTLTAAVGQYSRSRYNSDSSTYSVIPGGTTPAAAQTQLVAQFAVPSAYRQLVEPTTALAPIEDSFYVQRALHSSVGVAVTPADGWSIELVGFNRALRGSTELAALDRTLERRWSSTYGLELMLRRALTRKLYGWASYTLMRSDQVLQRPLEDTVEREPSSFDQRHNLNLVLSYQLPKRWRVGGRFRLSSGIPYTPVIGSRDFGGWILPVFGPENSARFPWFHQLDLRVDKRWLLNRASVTLYLDIQNVYGGQPVELYTYSGDFRRRQGMPILPILPVLGLQVDY